jgi:hypothetical protein
MKTKALLFTGGLFLTATTFAQGFTIDNLSHKELLYLGYDNRITIEQTGCEYESFTLESENCEVSKVSNSEEDNIYVVRAKRNAFGKTAKIFYVVDDVKVDSTTFHVQPLPAPSLMWGNNAAGTDLSDSREISIKYARGIPLNASFNVVGWISESRDHKFEGQGNLLSDDFLQHASTLRTGEAVKIIVDYTGGDGVTRRMSGIWIKE